MILISVQISVHYYLHIIELDVQNCQLIKSTFFGMLRQARVIRSSYSLLLWVFLSIQRFSSIPIKRKLDKSGDLEYHDTGPPRLIYLPGNVRSKWYLTLLLQCASALLLKEHTLSCVQIDIFKQCQQSLFARKCK